MSQKGLCGTDAGSASDNADTPPCGGGHSTNSHSFSFSLSLSFASFAPEGLGEAGADPKDDKELVGDRGWRDEDDGSRVRPSSDIISRVLISSLSLFISVGLTDCDVLKLPIEKRALGGSLMMAR